MPVTKLGRLVKEGKIKSVDDIFRMSIPIKEHQIVDQLCPNLKDEVMNIMPVQKQTTAGQRTRFKCYVAVGDHDGLIALGQKCSKEVANAIRGAITNAKLHLIRVRMGYWGGRLGEWSRVNWEVSSLVGGDTQGAEEPSRAQAQLTRTLLLVVLSLHRQAPHRSGKGYWQVRICPRAPGPSSARHRARRRTNREEAAVHGGSQGCLHLRSRPHAVDRQLCAGGVQVP